MQNNNFTVAIFENNFEDFVSFFNLINRRHFGDKLVLRFFSRSQDFKIEQLSTVDLVIMDLALGTHSDFDGYAMIELLKQQHFCPPIIVMTGRCFSSKQARDSILEDLPTLIKPVEMELMVTEIFKHFSVNR